ncbi:MAG: histidine--tRNA ligase [Fervidicoccaceae archaeon]|jgi:histidyl-tRNA synthetase|nr:MAG: histidine--tRNA ligase [Fervidicoccus sp.]
MRRIEIPRGFRDFPPETMKARLNVIEKVRKVFERSGFPPMDTPSLEYWETLAGKYGEEAETKLIWRFKDPLSNRDFALRYDLTVPLARYIALHPEIYLPFKRHQISLVWRHEEPQRGRYREFIQADIDTVGSTYIEADAEIINTISMALEELGLKDYIVKINHRGLLRDVIEKRFGILSNNILRTIDKLDKIGEDGVKQELKKLGLNEEQIQTISSLFIRVKLDDTASLFDIIGREYREKYVSIFNELFSLLYYKNKAVFDFSLVRGLDYYTGIIFEIVLTEGSPGSVAGGGRYDNLIGMLKGEPLPATGGSLGIERVIDVMVERGLIKLEPITFGAFVVVLDNEAFPLAWEYVMKLRERGITAEIDLMRRSPEKQRKRLNTLNYTYAIYIGKKELETKKVTLYNRLKGMRLEIELNESLKYLEEELRR